VKKTAAIFDLDGTLIRGASSEQIFITKLLLKGKIYPWDMIRFFATTFFRFGDWKRMFLENKYHLKGESLEKLSNFAEDYFCPRIDRMVPARMKELIKRHKQNGDLLIVISGTMDFILDTFADTLGFDDKKGTELEAQDGKLTGRIKGIHPYGKGKVVALEEFQKKYDLDLAHSTIYANHYPDRFVMEKVGHPIAVNPSYRLLWYAKKHGWHIIQHFL
jgi:putative phosphoserine phosphatase / 1-acylglycerol-3-phosphate O-acyltransferase